MKKIEFMIKLRKAYLSPYILKIKSIVSEITFKSNLLNAEDSETEFTESVVFSSFTKCYEKEFHDKKKTTTIWVINSKKMNIFEFGGRI